MVKMPFPLGSYKGWTRTLRWNSGRAGPGAVFCLGEARCCPAELVATLCGRRWQWITICVTDWGTVVEAGWWVLANTQACLGILLQSWQMWALYLPDLDVIRRWRTPLSASLLWQSKFAPFDSLSANAMTCLQSNRLFHKCSFTIQTEVQPELMSMRSLGRYPDRHTCADCNTCLYGHDFHKWIQLCLPKKSKHCG